MKESSADQPKKKLIQARLPFQILSPVVKNPEPRKRKASDTTIDADTSEVINVKENQGAPVDKKLKFINSTSHVNLKDENTSETNLDVETKGEQMETENETKSSETSPKITPKEKLKLNKPKRSYTRKNRPIIHIELSPKVVIDKSKENVTSSVVDFIDLCDSPSKKNESSETIIIPKTNQKIPLNTAITETEALEPNLESSEGEKKTQLTNTNPSTTDEEPNRKRKRDDAFTNDSPEEMSINNELCSQKDNQENPISNNRKTDGVSSTDEKTPSKALQHSLNESTPRTPSLNDSGSECSSPSVATDTPTIVKKLTPRQMTPKQLLKIKEKEGKKKEKELLKQEREKKKADEKEEKQRLRQEKEEIKRKEKEEKQKEKEEKEKKKQAEIAQKNEERRIKEEEKRVKDEEKKAKEEEERKKKEEKRLKEEQKQAEKRKSAQAFVSFFMKSETKPFIDEGVSNEVIPTKSNFQPFEVKNDMRLAPLVRSVMTQDRRKNLDSLFNDSQRRTASTLYIKQLQDPTYVKGISSKTWPYSDDTEDDDVIIIESEKPISKLVTGINMDSIAEKGKRIEKKRHRAKLLQFHENRRPPYWGTWRKKSKFIHPRTPFNEDKTMFEYDIDSDDEWEEPEDGESLRGSEDEESQDEQYEEDNDMFVPHGYLSDEEGQDDFDDKSPEAMKAKLKFLQLEFEAERNEKQEKLKPRLIGCVWFSNMDSDPAAVGSQIADIFLSRRAVWEGILPLRLAPAIPSPGPQPTDVVEEESRGAKKKLVPESMIPTIIRVVHGSRRKLSRMLADLLNNCEADKKPSKRCLADKIRELASWTQCEETGQHCWYVKSELRDTYNLMDLKITATKTTPSINIKKFTKVLTSDERLQLLSAYKESPKPASISQTVTPNPTNPTVKKRVSFTTICPTQSTNMISNFVTVTSKENISSKPTETVNNEKKVVDNVQTAKVTDEKVIKRIKPITLMSTVTKPPLHDSKDECIVLSD